MSIILKKLISNSKDEKSFVATEDLIKFAKDRYHLLDTKDEESFVRVICVVDVCYSCGHHQLYYCNYNDDYRIQEINIDDVEIIAPLKYFVNYFNTSNCCYYLFDNEYHDSFEDIYPLKIGTSNEYHDYYEYTYDKNTVYAYKIIGTKHLDYKCANCATEEENKETLMSILNRYNVCISNKITKESIEQICTNRSSLKDIVLGPVKYICGCEADDYDYDDYSYDEEEEEDKYNCLNAIAYRDDTTKDILSNLDIELSKLDKDNSTHLFLSEIRVRSYKDKNKDMFSCSIVISKTKEELCDNCYKVQQIKEQNDFSIFDSMLLSHGLATGYSGMVTINDCIDRAYEIYKNPNWEICCSNYTQKIGAFGFICKGENTFVSCHDVWSRLNALGQRVFSVDSNDEEDSICCDRMKYVHNVITKQYNHSEHFVKNVQIQYFWIKEWAIGNTNECIITKEDCEKLKAILQDLGYDLKIVKSRNAD